MRTFRFGVVAVVAACSSPAVPGIHPPGPVAHRSEAVNAEATQLSPDDRKRDDALVPIASAAVDAFANWTPFASLIAAWSPDGTQMLFGSDRDGQAEIYASDPANPESPATAVTKGPSSASWAAYTADGSAIVFLRDNGGDENYAIWRVNRDGTGLVNLTPGPPMHRDEPLLPRKNPTTMLYSAARGGEPTAYLYQQSLAGGEPRVVYTQQVLGSALDATADGTHVLFAEFHADNDIVTRDIDVATGTTRLVYPPEGSKAGMYGATYAADGKHVLIATDESDKVVLLSIDIATGKEVSHYHDTNATAPLSIAPSPNGDLVAVGVDAGNHGEVRILDARTLTLQRVVKAPLGDVKLGTFRPDGGAFSIMISLPNQPPDLFAVDPGSGAVRPLRQESRPALDKLPAVTVSIEFARSFDALQIPINVYRPLHTGTKRAKTIVMFHGGPSSSYPVRWSPFVRFFTSIGYVVLEPNVRGSTGFGRAYEMADNREKRADWLRDVATVNDWAKQQPWCDPDRIVVFGGSYGGYTTLMALTRQPTAWRAGVDLFGPADLKQFLLTTDASIRAGFVPEFGDVEKDAALLEEFSPMRDVDRIERPLFVYAGQNDPVVPRSESDSIVTALRRRGIPVEYMVAANEGHGVDQRDTKIELLTRVARFLEDAMR